MTRGNDLKKHEKDNEILGISLVENIPLKKVVAVESRCCQTSKELL